MDFNELNILNNALYRISKNEISGIDIIYETIGGRMLSVAIGVVKNRQLAEDVVQDSFVKIIQNINRYKLNSNSYAWICKIVKNTALNKLKSENIRTGENIDEFYSLSDNNVNESNIENTLTAEKIMSALNIKQRKMIYYKYYMDMTVREISKKMNIPKSTVFTEIKNAENIMKNCIT